MSAAPNAVGMADYQPWCHIDVLHEYFDGAGQPGCEVTPTPTTRKVLERFGMIVGAAGHRFTIYTDSQRPDNGFSETIASKELIFRLSVRGDAFQLYTDLPRRPGHVLLLSTGAVGVVAGGGPLTTGSQVSEDDLLALTTESFDYQTKPPLAGGTKLQVIDRSGNQFATVTATRSPGLPIDVGGFGPGSYTLVRGKRQIYAFMAEPSLIGAPSIGVVSIFGRDVLESVSRGTKKPTKLGNKAAAPVYTVTYPARSSVWRYDIFAKGQTAGNYSVSESPGHDAMSFTPVEGVRTPAGGLSMSFESDATRPIPMRARPAHQFQLLDDRRVILDALPTPALGLNRGSDGRQLCSRMFIHL